MRTRGGAAGLRPLPGGCSRPRSGPGRRAGRGRTGRAEELLEGLAGKPFAVLPSPPGRRFPAAGPVPQRCRDP